MTLSLNVGGEKCFSLLQTLLQTPCKTLPQEYTTTTSNSPPAMLGIKGIAIPKVLLYGRRARERERTKHRNNKDNMAKLTSFINPCSR